MVNISLDNTLGVFFIGATLSNILFGITSLQSAIYYKNYPSDGWIYKVSVGIIWVLDALDVAVTTHASYFYSITNFGHLPALTQRDIVWSLKLHILLCVLVRISVQAVYALRLWKLGQVIVTAGNAGTEKPAVLEYNPVIDKHNSLLGCGIYLIKDVYELTFSSLSVADNIFNSYLVSSFSKTPTIESALISMFVSSVVAEFVVSIAMCYCLDRTTSVFPNTITTLLTLMRMILMSGFITSFYSIVILTTFLLWPNTLIFLGVDCLLPKLFINSLLAMLNARREFRNVDNSFRLPTIVSSGLTSESASGHRANNATVVSMKIESETV
ncbi:uncharacterized protein EV420DRAFT_1648347 [Desarmillaria tabescens]|uniref:DUF6534 domain-containing protein n=1 Tax=Armillaria tabescens TaxID=1929756 RepID=A0AA39JMR3_ARMTA|nr:uncharacterized protein EV420DRAFT_1648347 [Desarmillaria tabescens]KAK0445626.1 hypothetical protein EV420DRAFT_1648347 [Desarmillaria tabescens]